MADRSPDLVEPVDPALPRWLVLTDDRDGDAAHAVAAGAAALPGSVDLTWAAPADDWRAALGRHDLVVDLVPPRPGDIDGPRWHHVLAASRSVLVRTAGDVALREPVALGVAGRLPLEPTADDVVTAVRRLAEKAPDAPRDVARSWLLRPGAGEDTGPRVLVLAVTRAAAGLAAGTARAVAGEGGRTVVATHSGVRAAVGTLPASARLVEVPDPVATWLPVRAEALLLHRGPRTVTRVLRGLLRRATRLPGVTPARVAGPGRSLDRLDAARARVAAGVERRAWDPLLARLRPWLVARALAPRLDLVGEVDLVVAADTEATALVWRLLRADPDLESRSAMKRVALESVVRRRTVRWVEQHPNSG